MTSYLFISHVPYRSLFGAGTSLRYLLTGLSSCLPDSRLILLQQGWRSPFAFLQKNCLFVLPTFLPLFRTYEGYRPSLLASCLLFLIDILSFFPFCASLFIIPFIRPNVVHFNSIVLSHLLPVFRLLARRSFICLHVREIPSPKYSFFYCLFWSFADSLICIDSTTYNRVQALLSNSHFDIPDLHLMYNPVICSSLKPSLLSLGVKPLINKPYVFCFVGRLSPEKNIDFIVDSFISSSPQDAILLLVGSGSPSYLRSLRSRFPVDSNIYILPSIPNISESGFYNSIDCLIRCDPVMSIGRTVLESLVHSTPVLMRGTPSQLDSAFIDSPLSSLIFFYGDSSYSLSQVFSNLRPSRVKLTDIDLSSTPISTPSSYAARFSAISNK